MKLFSLEKKLNISLKGVENDFGIVMNGIDDRIRMFQTANTGGDYTVE